MKFDGWNTIDYEYFYQGTYSITNHAEAQATFYGVGVVVRYVKDDNLQDMEIYIDDVLQVTIDESNNPDRPYLNNKERGEWYSDVLPPGEHVLRLVPTESSTIAFDVIMIIGENDHSIKTTRISMPYDGIQTPGWSWWPDISVNGRFIAFGSEVSNLIPNNEYPYNQVYVHDLETDQKEIVSVSTDGQASGATLEPVTLSADGRFCSILIPCLGID